MASLSFVTSISLLLLALPTSVLSVPAPGPQLPAPALVQAATVPPPDRIHYKVTAAELQSVKGVSPEGNSAEGENNALNITVSGVNPGDRTIGCFGKWFQDAAETDGTSVEDFQCTDPAMQMTAFEYSKLTPDSIRLTVSVQYQGYSTGARWYSETADKNTWVCEVDLCTLKPDEFVIRNEAEEREQEQGAAQQTAGDPTASDQTADE